MTHHHPDDTRSGQDIAEEYFAKVLSRHLAPETAVAVAKELAGGLRGYEPSVVLIQNGHFTRILEAIEKLKSQVLHLEIAQDGQY